MLNFFKKKKIVNTAFAALCVMAASVLIAYVHSEKDIAALKGVSRGFSGVKVSSSSEGVSLRAKYHEAGKISAFSGHKPVKQLVYVRNSSKINQTIPVVLEQEIPDSGVFFNGKPVNLPKSENPVIINETNAASANIIFFTPSGNKVMAGKYDWSDVLNLRHGVKVWQENGHGVIQLTVKRRGSRLRRNNRPGF